MTFTANLFQSNNTGRIFDHITCKFNQLLVPEHEFPNPGPHPALVIFLTLVTAFLGFALVGPLIGFLVALPFYEGGLLELTEAVADPLSSPELKVPLFIMQGFATLVGLIIAPMLMLMVIKRPVSDLFQYKKGGTLPIILTVIIVIVFTGFNSIFIDWNSKLDLPDFMRGFEELARDREEYARKITTFLTQFDSTGQFVLAFIVIAILPAIGEELVFRGLIQRELVKSNVNVHVAIWFAALLFSAIHMQFYGLVPRMLLGALFGYLYYWSGNLTLAMVAHFINNGFAIVGMYLYQRGTVDVDMESTDALAWPYILSSALLTTLLLYYFKKYYEHQPSSIDR